MQFQLTKDFLSELETSLEANNESQVVALLEEIHAADIAEIVEELDLNHAKLL